MASNQQRLRAIVSGRVQGVSFRYYTKKEADQLGVTGWVRNNHDRTVELLAEGNSEQLARLHTFLQTGSPDARVDNVDATYSEASGEFSSFEVTYFR